MHSGKLSRYVVTLVCALAAGCADGGVEESDPSAAVDPTPVEEPAPVAGEPVARPDDVGPTPARWTADATDVDHSVSVAAVLTEVATSANEGFDRMILEFEGDEMPSYHIEYIDRPVVQCGSGEPVAIAGDAWLAVRLEPANAHTEEGVATIEERSSLPDLDVLRQLTMTCDFEAQVQWVMGVASPNLYRVMELADPTRLVVDVRH